MDELMEEHGKSEEKSETEKELIEERKSKRESGEDVEDKVRENLKKYLDTGEKEYLEKADKYAKRGTCGACVRSVEKALEAHENGDLEKAEGLAGVVVRGIQAGKSM